MVVAGTWNLENLFRPGSDSGPDDAAAYQGKLAGLAATINTEAPDVLGVQEVGQPEALADLVALLDGTWHTILSEHFDASHPIRVGVLSHAPHQRPVHGVSQTRRQGNRTRPGVRRAGTSRSSPGAEAAKLHSWWWAPARASWWSGQAPGRSWSWRRRALPRP
jgi:hypothetical protein